MVFDKNYDIQLSDNFNVRIYKGQILLISNKGGVYESERSTLSTLAYSSTYVFLYGTLMDDMYCCFLDRHYRSRYICSL